MTCPFCDPHIQHSLFARSEHFLAVYNIAPILPGHSLIIPKKHIQSVMELDNLALTEMIRFTREVTEIVLMAFHADAFNWSVQEKHAAGQSIAHLHFHIVPRYPDDFPDPGDWYPKISSNYEEMLDNGNRKKLSDSDMKQIITQLRIIAGQRFLYSPG
jgi:bis(5'-adenosyl)-triphosphatase